MGQKIICNLCQHKNFQEIFRQKESRILKCRNCGLIFRHPQPSRAEIQKLYDQKKYLENPYFAGLKKGYTSKNPAVIIYQKELGKLNKIKKPGRILDLGCAYGVFLDLARKYGWKTYGVEVARQSAVYARKNFDLKIFCGTLEEAKFKNNFFRAMTMWDVIEHLPNPFQTLKEINRILEKNGILLILTIDMESLIGRLAGLTSKTKDFLYDFQHTYFFSKRTLQKMLKRAGFRKIETFDTFGAQIKRWHSREIPFIFSFGTDLLDILAKSTGMDYRQVVIARK